MRESAYSTDALTGPPLRSQQMKGYVPDAHVSAPASSKHPEGVDQFYEIKTIHSGAAGPYQHAETRDNSRGGAAVELKQKGLRKEYIKELHKKDERHFRTPAGQRGPLETIFRQMNFKGLVFGTFGEMSSAVGEMVTLAVDYGMEHLGRAIGAADIDVIRATIRRRHTSRIVMANWRGYANLIIGRSKYIGTGSTMNRMQLTHHLQARADRGDFASFSCAHEIDRMVPDTRPWGWVS